MNTFFFKFGYKNGYKKAYRKVYWAYQVKIFSRSSYSDSLKLEGQAYDYFQMYKRITLFLRHEIRNWFPDGDVFSNLA